MPDDSTETMVRQWLREHAGKVYCAECLASALHHPDADVIRVVLGTLARQDFFWSGSCLCGGMGVRYGW